MTRGRALTPESAAEDIDEFEMLLGYENLDGASRRMGMSLRSIQRRYDLLPERTRPAGLSQAAVRKWRSAS